MNQPTYFAFDPSHFSQEEAFNRARPFLYHDSIIFVFVTNILGKTITRSVRSLQLPGYTLVQVNPNGTQEIIQ